MSRQELPTRQQVLHLLKRQGGMTVKQLSHALGITPMGVRQHLDALARQGLIAFEWSRSGRGRPSQVFYLSSKGDELFPRSYGQLALSLLQEIEEIGGTALVERVFAGRSERIRQKYEQRMKACTSLREKVQALAELREEEGYLVEWAELADGIFRFVEHNCPLHMVAARYPDACRNEQRLLQEVLSPECEVRREEHIATGGSQCSYVIKVRPLHSQPASGPPS